MSRTLKDRPYWVQLNESAWYDHNHTHLGEVAYMYKYIKDRDGNLVCDETEWGLTATEIAEHGRVTHEIWRTRWEINPNYLYRAFGYMDAKGISPYVSKGVVLRARDLVFQGAGDTYLMCGTYKKVRRELVVSYVTADHCTEGEPVTSTNYRFWRAGAGETINPCTPSWRGMYEVGHTSQVRNMSKAKRGYSQEVNGHSRRVARDTLKDQANAWNSGWNVEDWDEDEDLTAQHRHSMNWMLW